MADFAEVLQDFDSLVVDYSAFLELGDASVLESLVSSVISQQKTVFISKAFKAYHECVVRAANASEDDISDAIRDALHDLVDAKLLRASKSASTVDFFLEHMKNGGECLFIGRNSNAFSRLRNINASGSCSVFVVDRGAIRFYPDVATCMEAEPPYSVNPISGNADYLELDIYFSVGDVLYTDEREKITLSSLISTGAEGLVFNTNSDGWVAKVYHKGGITPLRWLKLMKMRDLGLVADNICWPYRLLFSKDNVPVGYLMKKAEGVTISRAFDGPDAMNNYFPSWSRLQVVDATLGFLRIMDYLHLHGVIAGDIQLKNAMLSDEDHVYLIDIDSVQYQDLPCPVGTEEFTRPELWDKSFVSFLRRPQDEDYSIAILVFSMLFCGQHPYAQRNGLETLRDEMAARSFPYTVDDSQTDRIPIGGYDKIWDALTPTLKDMFVRAFAKGELFDCVEWSVALTEYRDKLANHEFEDEEYYNVFPYFVEEEEEAPKKKKTGGKVSVREAVMNSNLNSAETMDMYDRQTDHGSSSHARPVQQTPSMKGSASPFVPQNRPEPKSSDSDSPYRINQASDNRNSGSASRSDRAASSASSGKNAPKKEGLFGFLKRRKGAVLLFAAFSAAIAALIYLASK